MGERPHRVERGVSRMEAGTQRVERGVVKRSGEESIACIDDSDCVNLGKLGLAKISGNTFFRNCY